MNNENILEFHEMELAVNILENVCNIIPDYQKQQVENVIDALKKCMNENIDIKKFVD